MSASFIPDSRPVRRRPVPTSRDIALARIMRRIDWARVLERSLATHPEEGGEGQ